MFGDHIVGNTADIVIGISKMEKFTKVEDPFTGTKELKIEYLEEQE